MKTIITKSWEFRTYSIKGVCKCFKCGKPITKTFSFQTRKDILTTKEDWNKIEKQKEEWQKEPHICNACKKKKIEQERKDITNRFSDYFTELNISQKQITDIKLEKKKVIEQLNNQLKDRVILYNGNEYVVNYIQDGIYEDCAVEINCIPISKTKPWLMSSGSIFFYKQTYKQCGWNNFVEIGNCIITDEIFSKRKQLLIEGENG